MAILKAAINRRTPKGLGGGSFDEVCFQIDLEMAAAHFVEEGIDIK